MPLPTGAFAPAETINARHMWADITPTGGALTSIKLKALSVQTSQEFLDRLIPVGDYIQADRSLPTTRELVFIATVEEFTQAFLNLVLGATYTTGTCTITITDPDDATSTVAIQTNAFGCTVTLEGNIEFGQDVISSYTLRIKATTPWPTFTRDVSVA